MATLKSLVDVTKPKQTLLLMVTFAVAYIVAAAHDFAVLHFAQAFLATLLAVAGTTALNMWLDRDIDALMPRTRERAVPSGVLTPRHCALYGTFLFILGLIIGAPIGLLFAVVLSLGLFFDIVIYTLLLKRKKTYSIVLGGLAGAMPALAGWIAAAGFSIEGLLIAAIVLLWIPSHIWYLAMHYEEDYRMANIPMLPLVVGMEKTSWAIVLSIVLMLLLIASLYVLYSFGFVFFALAAAITSYLLYRSIKFARSPDRARAKSMFKLASMTLGVIYVALLVSAFV